MKYLLVLMLVLVSAPVHAERPVILVPGWGPSIITSMKKLRKYLSKNGYVANEHIYEVQYPYRKDLESVKESLSQKLGEIFSRYEADQKFDFITHSLGQPASLYTILESGFAHKTSHFVGLAGVAHGQTKYPLFCKLGFCGKTMDALVPHNNPFILSFMEKHEESLSKIQKCSFYSLDDGMIDSPPDSGAFPDGLNVELTGVKHMDFIHDPCVFQTILRSCFGWELTGTECKS